LYCFKILICEQIGVEPNIREAYSRWDLTNAKWYNFLTVLIELKFEHVRVINSNCENDMTGNGHQFRGPHNNKQHSS